MYDLIVIGGGVNGMASAVHAARKGLKTIVLERDKPGAGASSAAAGMLGASTEWLPDEKIRSYAESARDYLKKWVPDLEKQTGVQAGLKKTGAWRLAYSEKGREELEAHAEKAGLTLEEAPEIDGVRQPLAGISFPQEAQVEATAYLNTLAAAAEAAGVDIIYPAQATNVAAENGFWAVTAAGKVYVGRHVLYAGGIGPAPCPGMPEMVPVKGECLRFQPESPVLNTVLVTETVYLVPKADGSVICGATETPYDTTLHVKPASEEWLLNEAVRICPELSGGAVNQKWAGVRPKSVHGRPAIGRLAAGLYVNTGHYRNGILFSGYTGKLLAEACESGTVPEALQPFHPEGE
ncbi:NAD(P)/FAD-dependent oxidoreductase [Alkalicoccus luteus]|uniref:Aerobic glycerol-3-phosphate dehydrogenase n=1 Tax=Alkalicoccus luteus TaxID=1237094 RepID=A0A969TXA8_9BACI|nr:FAD-dependent oxidoreductase [Alkalicoccus luteus]NJP38079.1 FAD-dependent oxidoreductase [Alkalicoccus luteus]